MSRRLDSRRSAMERKSLVITEVEHSLSGTPPLDELYAGWYQLPFVFDGLKLVDAFRRDLGRRIDFRPAKRDLCVGMQHGVLIEPPLFLRLGNANCDAFARVGRCRSGVADSNSAWVVTKNGDREALQTSSERRRDNPIGDATKCQSAEVALSFFAMKDPLLRL